jgi:O-acetyl-ADP-ribose deacetylase (regulator of RNase III)
LAVYELVYISLQCDAIVNSTSDDLYLDQGAVSATILAAAGEEIQKECDKIIIRRGRKPLSPMEVEMTKGYNLGCKYVLHGALVPDWNEQV